MIYFFHHYELPIIIQQARIQQMLVIRTRQQRPQNPTEGGNQEDQPGGNITQDETQIAIITPRNNIRGRNRNNNNNNNASFWRNPQFYATVWFFLEQFLLYIATMSNPIFHIIEEMLFRMAGMNNMNMFPNQRIRINIGHINMTQAQINSLVLDENLENLPVDQLLDEADNEFNAAQPDEFIPGANWSDGSGVDVPHEGPVENVPVPVPVISAESVVSEQTADPALTEPLDDNDIGKDFEVLSSKNDTFDSMDTYSAERISSAIKHLEVIPNDTSTVDIPSKLDSSEMLLLENPNEKRLTGHGHESPSSSYDDSSLGGASSRAACIDGSATEFSESQREGETSIYERHKTSNRDRL